MREWPEDRAIAEMDEQASAALLKLLAFAAAVALFLWACFAFPLPRY